jgi:sec-independent protein translocase protein TatA
MGIGMRELLIILLVVLLVFGAKKLRTIGADLGAAVRGFKKSVSEGEAAADEEPAQDARQIRAEKAPDAEFPETRKAAQDQGSDRRSA